MTSGSDPVVVTGLGATTPIGGTAAETWEGLLAARSGTRLLTGERYDDLPVRIAATAAVDPSTVLDRVRARRLDRGQQFAIVATQEAWADAGSPDIDRTRLGVVVGTGIGGVSTLLNGYDTLTVTGARGVNPLSVPMLMANGPAAAVGLELGARAAVHAPVSACASGAEAVSLGLDLIRLGRADMVVCGGTEAAVHPLPLSAFAAMRALSTREEDPEGASRPFDKRRDGFVLGEGAGMLVLERESSARARGARIYAVLAGSGISADSHHVAQPDPTGAGVVRALRAALRDSGLTPEDITHLNAHATSTPLGDLAEARAVIEVMGPAVDQLAVTAPKGSLGHLLGAAGAVESIATVLAIQTGQVPPTRNLDDPDDEVHLDVVRVSPRPMRPGAALCTSFGFGGHDVALVFAPAS